MDISCDRVHGDSRDIPWISLPEVAEEIVTLIREKANGGRATIVGLSLGAYLGAQILSVAPELVEGAVLSGLSVLPLLGSPRLMKLMFWGMSFLIKREFAIRANAKALRIPDAMYDEYRDGARQVARRAFLHASLDAADFRVPSGLERVNAPVLLVAGAFEHPLIHESLGVMAEPLPVVQTAVVPDVGHAWVAEAPELFAEMVRCWVEKRPLPPALQTQIDNKPHLNAP